MSPPLAEVSSPYPGRSDVYTGGQRKSRGLALGRDPRSSRAKWLHMPLIRLSRYASVGGADLRKEA